MIVVKYFLGVKGVRSKVVRSKVVRSKGSREIILKLKKFFLGVKEVTAPFGR